MEVTVYSLSFWDGNGKSVLELQHSIGAWSALDWNGYICMCIGVWFWSVQEKLKMSSNIYNLPLLYALNVKL
jgi:hypothetical protein